MLGAMLDLATEKGLLSTAINIVHVMQMLHQGMWWNDTPYKNIPYFTKRVLDFLEDQDIHDFVELV
jgi:hypothetical protein